MPIWGGLTLAPALVRLIGYAVAAVAVLALIYWAAVVPRLELRDERIAHQATVVACTEMRAKWAEELAAAHARARHTEQKYQVTVDNARRSLDEARTEIAIKDRTIAAARSDARGLRKQLADRAAAVRLSGDPGATGDALGAIAELAGQGSELLDEGRGLLRQCAADHDTAVAERDALIAAWPR
jgi:hypothetical protein